MVDCDDITPQQQKIALMAKSFEDAMVIALMDTLSAVPWETTCRAADLGGGTGRTGEWLGRHGVGSIDGVDLTR